ncbi:MAG: WD40 repeat domain-containing protein, partial [Caldilineaceae bacterium]|nr:WD40 repeat domain-containing protein [Caldilineaceae bacterium]
MTALSFRCDSRLLASASHDGTLRIWQVEPDAQLYVLDGQGPLLAVAFSPDGTQLAGGGYSSKVYVWDALQGQILCTFIGHTDEVNAVSFHPNGRTLASAGSDGHIYLWEIRSGGVHPTSRLRESPILKPLQMLAPLQKSPIWSLAFSPDGKLLAGGMETGEIAVWDTVDYRVMRAFHGHRRTVRALIFGSQSRILYSGNGGGASEIRLWDIVHNEQIDGIPQDETTWSLALTSDGQTLANGCENGTVHLWDVADPTRVRCIFTHYGQRKAMQALAWSRCGHWVAIGDIHGVVRVLDVTGPTPVQRHVLLCEDGLVSNIAFSPDSSILATLSGFDGQYSLQLWDAESGRRLHRMNLHVEQLSLAFAHGGRWLICSGWDGALRFWEVANPDAAPLRQIVHAQSRRLVMACATDGDV